MDKKEERLRRLFANMDSDKLAVQAQDPQMTPMAKTLAHAELQAREGLPGAGDTEATGAVTTTEPSSGIRARHIVTSALGMLLGALAFEQYDLAILGSAIILILIARLLPSFGAACGLALLLSPLWFWLAGWYATGNWFINCILIFMSLIPTGIGLAMLEATFFRGEDADFLRDLSQKAGRAASILIRRRR